MKLADSAIIVRIKTQFMLFAALAVGGCAQVGQAGSKGLNVGDPFPDPATFSIEGKLPETLKGKVVVVDFWASWCGPCRSSNKLLTKIYPKYKAKGFEIFGVSLDDDKDKWANAIKKDKISWLQVNDGGGWNAQTAIQWGINAIPTSYLIDKNGRLVAMDLEGKELEKALKDLLED